MASKKNLLLAGVFSLFAVSAAVAQTGTTSVYKGSGYDVLDSSLIPARRMDQQRDFLNRNYDYSARPRNQWEIAIGVGGENISGDVRSKSFYNRPEKGNVLNTMAWDLSIRKAWGYVISTRLNYTQGAATGYNWQSSTGYNTHDNPYNANYGVATPYGGKKVFYAYKTQVRELTLDMIAALNNVKFHKARNKTSVYGIFGVGGLLYYCANDLLDKNGNTYNFDSINNKIITYSPVTTGWSNGYKSSRKNAEKMLVSMFDGKYETSAERHSNRYYVSNKYTFRPVAKFGLGVQFRVGKNVTLGIEDNVTYTMDDLLDGQQWQEPYGNASSVMTRDYDNINHLSVKLGLNIGAHAVAPLWWLNPMDYAYNEMTNPRRTKQKVGDCDKDSDGDGVSDCYDKCPDTQAGVAVDTKGCCLDTDGDGVCDYKDKQLITPTECQPVDADGIGKCPDPACCSKVGPAVVPCGTIGANTVMFGEGTKLTAAGMSQLSSLAAAMKANPSCKVVITGNGAGSKLEQQRSWARANAVINYMSNNLGIDRERFILNYGGSNGKNTVDYRSANDGEFGSSTVPPPHPNLK